MKIFWNKKKKHDKFLSKILHTSIEDILVIDGDIVFLIICKIGLSFMGLTSCEENVNMKKNEI